LTRYTVAHVPIPTELFVTEPTPFPRNSATRHTPAAYGDLFASILAVLAIWSLSARAWFATWMVLAFNLWGAADLLVAFYQGLLGVRIDPASLGAAYFIPTVLVPPLLVTHGLMFWLLLRKPSSTRHQAGRPSIIVHDADPNHPAIPVQWPSRR